MNTDPERLALLHADHASLIQEMRILKEQIRVRVARLEEIQRRLAEIEQAQNGTLAE
jgi:hypothetical protein